MRRRVSVLALSVILMFTSINWNGVDASAAMISDISVVCEDVITSEGLDGSSDIIIENIDTLPLDEANVDSIIDDNVEDNSAYSNDAFENKESENSLSEAVDKKSIVAEAVWEKLITISKNYNEFDYDKLAEEELKEGVFYAIKAEDDIDSNIIFVAENEDVKLELIVVKDSDECEIVYFVQADDIEIKSKQNIADVKTDLSLLVDGDSVSFKKYKENAEALLKTAILEWNDILEKHEIAWGDLGFKNWDKLCLDYAKEIETNTMESNELSDADESDSDLNVEDADIEDMDADALDVEADADELVGNELGQDEIIVSLDSESEEELIFEENEATEEKLEAYILESPKPERIVTNYDDIVMKVGETIQLDAKLYPENSNEYIHWSLQIDNISADNHTAEIDSSGLLIANRANVDNVSVVVEAGGFTKEIPVKVLSNDLEYLKDEDGNDITKTNLYGQIEVIADGIWVGGFERIENVYTGKPVFQPNLTVYYKGEKLTLNKDYSLSYKNNTNVCEADGLNAASVTVTMKGQYSGKKILYYEILARDIDEATIDTNGNALNYTGKDQKYVPVVTFNGKKLVNNKDFNIEYITGIYSFKGDANNIAQVDYIITGKGNWKGSKVGSYYIVPKQNNVSKAAISLSATVKLPSDIAHSDNLSDIKNYVLSSLNLKIKLQGEKTYSEIDPTLYEISMNIPEGPIYTGNGQVTIKGIDGSLLGQITKAFKIVAENNLTKVAEVNSDFELEKHFYNYSIEDYKLNKQTSDRLLSLKVNGDKLREHVDYEVTYQNYKKVGTVTAIFRGINAYTGTIKKTYKLINDTPDLSVNVFPSVEYVHGGTKTDIAITETIKLPDETITYYKLVENVDYTLKYINNTKVGLASVVVTYKGSYAKHAPEVKDFNITQLNIVNCKVAVPDKAYSGRANSYKSTPTVIAPNGKKLVAGKDYKKEIVYLYDDYDINNNPDPNTTIMVEINGINNYKGTALGSYKLYDSKTYNINKLYFSIGAQTYTGKQLEPKLGTGINDIKVYTSSANLKNNIPVTNPSDYVRIISFKNNIKTGTATVTLGGVYGSSIGYYGGTKNVSFKILKQDYKAYAVNRIVFENSKETINMTASSVSKEVKLLFNNGTTAPYNTCVVCKSSNDKIIKVDETVKADKGNDFLVINVTAMAAGSAVITCTSQDGNKVAKCTVISTMKPLQSIILPSYRLNLYSGTSGIIPKPTVVPEDAYYKLGDIPKYVSMDTSVATVDEVTGEVKAISKGVTSVVVSQYDKSTAVAVVVDEYPVVNVKDYGAVGDGITDDSDSINKALQEAQKLPIGKRNVYIPYGNYVVDVKYDDMNTQYLGLNLNHVNNMHITFSPGAVLVQGTDSGNDMRGLITVDWAHDLTIEGGTIDCQRSTAGVDEDYFGIMVSRSYNVNLLNMTIKDSNGDGIYLGKVYYDNVNVNKNITISGCDISGCRRNNIALVNVQDSVIENCKISSARAYMGSKGYAVGGTGIDVEPNAKESVENIQINNCTFVGNRSDFGIHCHHMNPSCIQTKDITLDKCSFDKLVAVQCGKNVIFKNTIKEPYSYYDDRIGGYNSFPNIIE